MRTLVHLSDLHFGAIEPGVLEPLKERVESVNPDVIAISGDLTQRARPRQFRAAREFLGRFSQPQVVVPGNHDVPLYAVAARFMTPLRRYRRHFASDVETEYVDAELAVVGVNTARSLVFKGGRINAEQVARVRRIFTQAPADAVRIVVTHHPLHVPPGWDERDQRAGRASMALEAFAECRVDICLSGHLHRSHSGHVEESGTPGRGPLVVAAGTATSSRSRTESNHFNVLRVETDAVRVERFGWNAGQRRFECELACEYRRVAAGWISLES